MKRLKNVLLVLAFVLFSGLTNVKAEGKVKVYIFEAGGCPYCEAEIEYLQGLDSYNEKFEIVQKELYVDHIDWEKGKDYELGKAVAEAFNSAGFEDASYSGTPFVVISNIYAAATYSTNLEGYINKAYEEGDKDVVSCYANGGENCLEGADPDIKVESTPSSNTKDDKNDVDAITTIILVLIIAGSIALVVYTGKRNAEIAEEVEEMPVVKEEKKEVVKAVNKSKTTKKSTTKKKR
jgi:glutaredoxin